MHFKKKKLNHGCHRRVCCLNFYRDGAYAYQKCKNGKISCPTKKKEDGAKSLKTMMDAKKKDVVLKKLEVEKQFS